MLQALDASGDTIILGLQDPSRHWLPGALGPPQTQSCGNKSSCWCWRHQRQALPDRVTSAVPSPTAKATVTAPSSASSRPAPVAREASWGSGSFCPSWSSGSWSCTRQACSRQHRSGQPWRMTLILLYSQRRKCASYWLQ
nr:uncharacterized protein LOC110124729 [Odocoileus virginianus texanus]